VAGQLEMGVASVDTGNAQRDKHLRSADFFNADDHPTMVFTVGEAKLGPSGDLAVSGELEAAGISRPLSFTAKITEASAEAATLTAEVQVDRHEYDMRWNRLGMVTGPATAWVVARFTRQP
jgi:polyisoprenoid-binding protein YceI